MAPPTRAQLRTRLEQIVDDIPSMGLLTGREEKLAATSLPASEVRRPAVVRKRMGVGQILVTLRYPVYVLVLALADSEKDAGIDTALDSCETWQDTIADYLEARQRLERNDTGLAFGMGEIEMSTPGISSYKELNVAGFIVTVPVTVIRTG